ncbi:3'(2'),5'-bisphosphate nucleotidase CysQ [Alsobacter sp. R-9]
MLDFRSPSLISGLADAASAAGAAIMAHYGTCRPTEKADGSPVTIADQEADAILTAAVRRLLPGLPVISEESAPTAKVTDFDAFVLIDPLDGTREFLAQNGDFTVNLAVVVNGTPVTGVVFAPAHGRLWTGGADAHVSSLEPGRPASAAGDRKLIKVRRPRKRLVAFASRNHRDASTDAYLARLGIHEVRTAGSSLKFCYIAQGDADLYPRFGPTMEWDTAAGHAVLTAAGGVVLTPDGEPFLYAKSEDDYRNGPFIAAASSTLVVAAAA